MEHVVIIGGGHAAAESVAALRQRGWKGAITLCSNESQLPYQRPPLSKGYFNGKVSSDSLAIKNAAFYEKAETGLMLGVTAVSIDREQHRVHLDNDSFLTYTHLIYATGTRPRLLEVPGADQAPLYYLRTLTDVDAIKPALQPGKRLLVIGAGYIGLEVAATAVQFGLEVTALEVQERVLARVTSPEMSSFFQQLHTNAGVNILTQAAVSHFEQSADEHRAVLQDGRSLAFDMAVVGIGVLANTELAETAGLDCNNGVWVDEYTQTTDPDIFAIGDCCNHPNHFYQRRLRLESVPNAAEQAKTAASVICGQAKPYTALPWFWSDQYDVKLQSAGLAEGYDHLHLLGDPDQKRFSILYFKAGRLICVDAINMPKAFFQARTRIMDAEKNDQTQVLEFFQTLL